MTTSCIHLCRTNFRLCKVFPPDGSNKTLTSLTAIALKNYLHQKKKIIARVKPIWDLLTIIFNGDKLLITTTKMAYMSDQGRSHVEAWGGLGPPKPQGSPPKKKKKLKKILKKLKFYPKIYYFFKFWPPNFFFSIWPPQVGGAGSAPVSDLVCLLYASALSLHFYTKREKNRLYNHSCTNKASGGKKTKRPSKSPRSGLRCYSLQQTELIPI
jgi:hypothetical protein